MVLSIINVVIKILNPNLLMFILYTYIYYFKCYACLNKDSIISELMDTQHLAALIKASWFFSDFCTSLKKDAVALRNH